MEARELRTGNLLSVHWKDDPIIVTGKIISEIDNYEHEYKPIPLTEEWLKRFGFERRNQHYPHKKIYLIGKFYIKFDIKYNFYYWAVYGSNTDYKIQFVHQLQNLYFALTGKEL